jgi:hypothetical protein
MMLQVPAFATTNGKSTRTLFPVLEVINEMCTGQGLEVVASLRFHLRNASLLAPAYDS